MIRRTTHSRGAFDVEEFHNDLCDFFLKYHNDQDSIFVDMEHNVKIFANVAKLKSNFWSHHVSL